jgi:hypothetical protein
MLLTYSPIVIEDGVRRGGHGDALGVDIYGTLKLVRGTFRVSLGLQVLSARYTLLQWHFQDMRQV